MMSMKNIAKAYNISVHKIDTQCREDATFQADIIINKDYSSTILGDMYPESWTHRTIMN